MENCYISKKIVAFILINKNHFNVIFARTFKHVLLEKKLWNIHIIVNNICEKLISIKKKKNIII